MPTIAGMRRHSPVEADDFVVIANGEKETKTQQIAEQHRLANIRVGEAEGGMADIGTGDAGPGLRQQAQHRAGETAELEAAARP